MKYLYLIICVICVICGSGCETVLQNSRIDYINKHPELTSEQKDLLLKGELWVGMTPQDTKASIGNPAYTQRDKLGEKEVWSYVYRDQYTTHRNYKFDRVLRLEFLDGRLANWRED